MQLTMDNKIVFYRSLTFRVFDRKEINGILAREKPRLGVVERINSARYYLSLYLLQYVFSTMLATIPVQIIHLLHVLTLSHFPTIFSFYFLRFCFVFYVYVTGPTTDF